MNVQKNARLTPCGREALVSRLKRGEHHQDVRTAMNVSASTVYKWRRRYRVEGLVGLLDRLSKPNANPNRTPNEVEAKVITLRKKRKFGLPVCTLMANAPHEPREVRKSADGLARR